ncbi:MAG: hypothetical protein HFE47_06835 [Clostridia bacterium]|nr:hypothetical protein [Clostridia bacterium]
MIKFDYEKVIENVVTDVTNCYYTEQETLKQIGLVHKTEGAIRYAAGELVEKVLQSIFNSINTFLDNKIISKVGGTDYLTKKIDYKGKTYVNNKIQVDRHVWYKNNRIAFIENKTYLDTCYYDRALADFKKIAQALVQEKIDPKACEFIVFAGQKAGKQNTFLTYEAEFWYETKNLLHSDSGIEPKIFFFLKGIRNSSKPLYKIRHELNTDAIKEFVTLILSILEKQL